jgi:biotin-dependent carboxylase-like uncharacterized protein
MIEILSTGLSNTVQDLGRFGYLDAGVSRSGAMDGQALEIANRLLGNDPGAAGLEIAVFPFRLRFLAACRFAIAGADCEARLDGRLLPNFWSIEVCEGAELRLSPPATGARVCIAFSGGIEVPAVLGSRSTDLKSGWGGLEGRGLNRGDRLALAAARNIPLAHLSAGFGADVSALRGAAREEESVRFLPGAEWENFGEAGQSLFRDTAWRLGAEANRQGYRFEGPALRPLERRELFSHGIMPGTVQVPPNGLPIIQMAEANTCGGYAKIAHVIEADLWRLAQMRPGQSLRFTPVTRHEAIEALREVARTMKKISADVRALTRDWQSTDS